MSRETGELRGSTCWGFPVTGRPNSPMPGPVADDQKEEEPKEPEPEKPSNVTKREKKWLEWERVTQVRPSRPTVY